MRRSQAKCNGYPGPDPRDQHRRTENVGPGVPNSLCDNCSVILTRVRFPDGARIFQVEKISQFLGLATKVNLVHEELRACDSSRSRGVSDGSPVDPLMARKTVFLPSPDFKVVGSKLTKLSRKNGTPPNFWWPTSLCCGSRPGVSGTLFLQRSGQKGRWNSSVGEPRVERKIFVDWLGADSTEHW